MKSTFYNYLFLLCILCLASCKWKTDKNKESNHQNTSHEVKKIQKEAPKVQNLAPQEIKSLSQFVPKDYFIFDSTIGKVDKNGMQHIALVCAPVSEKNTDEFIETKRQLILLQKNGTELKQIASNDELVLCKSCGGIFGDPYNGVDLDNNILRIGSYGGSAWRWSENYTFRFQNNQWELIGATYESYFNAKECADGVGSAGRQLEDINFAAGKMQIVHTKDDNCKPYEDYWKTFGKKKAISLTDFPGKASQWPGGKVKDGDGIE